MLLKPNLKFLTLLASSNVLANQCCSANSEAPKENFHESCSGPSSGTGVVAGYDFDYMCNKHPSTYEPGQRGFKTAQTCAEHRATDPQCKASVWRASSKLSAKVTTESYDAVIGDGWLFLEKNERSDKLSDDCQGQIDSVTKECKEREAKRQEENEACGEKIIRCESEKLRSEKSLDECQSSKDTLLQDNRNSPEKAMQCESKKTVLESQLDHCQKDQTTETTKCNDKIQQSEAEKRSAANQLGIRQSTIDRILSSPRMESFISDLKALTVFVLDDYSLEASKQEVRTFTSRYELDFELWGHDSKYYSGLSETEGRAIWVDKSASLLDRARGWESEPACYLSNKW
ncbi:hypothetical protein BDV38DRAFT_293602 [Aspergillus pseudotamarii]|uniref:Uncharacterized protein n=1 Tax=Aspergillus pseudotamarii TaxID=132259 RepID=A0A5N6SUK6_ASPPS|nr:uncharacterized protein BDV38DRAFT_293602 [Aspergillus pseudotamarii]KAE8137073.1 hypothetical protein BDV38DRAFT_293602 [Aspergillus pseudotamarii]